MWGSRLGVQALVLVLLVAAAGTVLIAREAGSDAKPDPSSNSATVASGVDSLLTRLALLGWPTPAPTPSPPPPPTAAAVAEVVEAPASEPPAGPPAVEAAQPPAPPPVDISVRLIDLVNAQRAARGLPGLAENGALVRSAQGYAGTLIQLGILSHAADGLDLLSRVRAAGYAGASAGEALWGGTGGFSPELVVAAWMASPPHSALLLDPGYLDAGAGCSFTGLQARCVIEVGA